MIESYNLKKKSIYLGDEYSAESNCSSLTHSRDQSPCNRTINNQEVSNSQKVNNLHLL